MVRVTTPESFTASHHALVKHTSAMLVPAETTDPAVADEGQVVYNKTDKKFKVYEV